MICVTVPEPPPEPDTHTPRTAKHPESKSMPPVDENEVVAALKLAIPLMENKVAGEEVPIPIFPLRSMNSVLVATPVEDEAMTNIGFVGERLCAPHEKRPHGEEVPMPKQGLSRHTLGSIETFAVVVALPPTVTTSVLLFG